MRLIGVFLGGVLAQAHSAILMWAVTVGPLTAQSASLSPSSIISRFDSKADARPADLWRTLKLSSRIAGIEAARCLGECAAVSFPGLHPGTDSVVRLCLSQFNGPCRYLYFRLSSPATSDWELAGSFDDAASRGPVTMRMEGGYWVVVTTEAFGTGVDAKADNWLSERCGRWVPVLKTPASGYVSPPGPLDRHWWALPLTVDENQVEIEFRLRFTAFDAGAARPLFDISRRGTCKTKNKCTPLRLDEMASEIRQVDIEAFFRDDYDGGPPVSKPLFLRFAQAELLAIARGAEGPKKAWLRAYLASVADTPEKRRLLAALGTAGK